MSAPGFSARVEALRRLEGELASWKRRRAILVRHEWARSALERGDLRELVRELDAARLRAELGALFAAAWARLWERESIACLAFLDALERNGFDLAAVQPGERAAAATLRTDSESPR